MKKKNFWLWLWFILAVVLLLTLSLGILYFTPEGDKGKLIKETPEVVSDVP